MVAPEGIEEQRRLVAAVAACLPRCWKIDQREDKHERFNGIKILGAGGMAFKVELYTDKGTRRLKVFGLYDLIKETGHGLWQVLPYEVEPPRITISAGRSPAAIAADIERRFIPGYLSLYARCEEAVQKSRAKKLELRLEVEALQRIAPLRVGGRSDQYFGMPTEYFLAGDNVPRVKVDMRRRSIEADGLTVEKMIQVLALVNS